jgi:hypothetical protein
MRGASVNDLYFFFDIGIAMLAFEMCGDDLPVATTQEIMFRLGRTYPGYWEKDGSLGHCPSRVEWLAADGTILAASDFGERWCYDVLRGLDYFRSAAMLTGGDPDPVSARRSVTSVPGTWLTVPGRSTGARKDACGSRSTTSQARPRGE